MTLSKRLSEAMKELGLTQGALAARVGIAQQSIQKILSGETRQPKNIVDIAVAVGKPVEWLLYGNEHAELLTLMYPIPVISFEDVPLWKTNEVQIRERAKKLQEEIPMHIPGYQKCYAVKVKNDLMVSDDPSSLSFKENEILIVDPLGDPNSGDFITAHQEGSPEAMFKKFVVDGPQRLLFSLKMPKTPMVMDEKTVIDGVVVVKYNIMEFRPPTI